MPKQATLPTLYDQAIKLDLSRLRALGYLQPDEVKSGSITWSRHGESVGSIGLYSSTINGQPFLRLDYRHNGTPYNYTVNIEAVPSNLGRGNVLYMVCPHTGKRCRKLYLIAGKFLHREAFRGCFYSSQIRSKKKRYWDNTIGAYFDADDILEQMYKKHAKKEYAGRPTKRHLKLMKKLDRSNSVTPSDIEKALNF